MCTLFYTDYLRIENHWTQSNYAENEQDCLSTYRRDGGYYELR